MSHYVVDASVAIKWFLPQVYADSAQSLLVGDHRLLVPDLLYTELGLGLWQGWNLLLRHNWGKLGHSA